MKNVLFLWIIMPLHSILAQPELSNSISHSGNKINVVHMQVLGNVSVMNATSDKIELDYEVKATGTVWGFSNKTKELIYLPKMSAQADTLNITFDQKKLWVVGIYTYSEEISHVLLVPKNVHLILETTGKVVFNSSCLKVTIKNASSTFLNIRKNETSKIICEATEGKVDLNGVEKRNSFEYATDKPGNEYYVKSKRIQVNLN